MPAKIPIRTLAQRSVEFPPAQNNPKAPSAGTERKRPAGGELSADQAVTESTLDGGDGHARFCCSNGIAIVIQPSPLIRPKRGKVSDLEPAPNPNNPRATRAYASAIRPSQGAKPAAR